MNGVVDHQIDGNAGFTRARISAEARNGRSQGGQIGDAGNSGEVLEDYAGREEGEFTGRRVWPVQEEADVLFGRAPALVAKNVLQEDANDVGESRDLLRGSDVTKREVFDGPSRSLERRRHSYEPLPLVVPQAYPASARPRPVGAGLGRTSRAVK